MTSLDDKFKDIKAVLTGYINESLSLLERGSVPDEKSVHNIRVLMKKSRATIRLASSQLDKKSYNKEFLTFREAGRTLHLWREASVHRKTLRSFRKKYPILFKSLKNTEIISHLLKKPEIAAIIPQDPDENISRINDILTRSKYRIRFQRLNNPEAPILLGEINKTYQKVSDLFIRARINPKPSNLHEFRKRLKDFLYQVYFLRPLKPGVIKNLEKRIAQMAQNLGKFNDLAVLIDTIGYKYGRQENDPALDELVILIKQAQDQYLSKIWPQAHMIFGPGKNLAGNLGLRPITY